MKIWCACGEPIIVQSDQLPYEAHVIPDQDWTRVLDAVHEAIELSNPETKKEASEHVRKLLREVVRSAYQCSGCGRVYLDDPDRNLHEFMPATAATSRTIFMSRNVAQGER